MSKDIPIRVRFAPSPTGMLHIGGARTALFNYLFAKKQQGRYLLRIEDTDLERSTDAAKQSILDAFEWLGITSDEPLVYQSTRNEIYQRYINILLANHHAYYCDCSKERLQEVREAQIRNKQKPKYDGHCRGKNKNKTNTSIVRFASPKDGAVTFTDLVYGEITVNNSEMDDLVIQRADGSSTYNFCVVVDDNDMQISHVIRGDDHINNTPRQINICKALNFPIPLFAHLPMINGQDGKKLSKRHGALAVNEYQKQGILASALLNFLARLGWSYGDQEIFSLEELEQFFDFAHVSKSPANFSHEKLLWLNQKHIQAQSPAQIYELIEDALLEDITQDTHTQMQAKQCIALYQERCTNMLEFSETLNILFAAKSEYSDKAKKYIQADNLATFELLKQAFADIAKDDWQQENIKQVIHQCAKTLDVKMGKVGMPLRAALTYSDSSPAIDELAAILGQERTLQRVQQCIEYIRFLIS